MPSSQRMLSSSDISRICEPDFFFDENVGSCQPCQDLCSGPEKQEGLICERECKDFIKRSSKIQDSSSLYITIGVSIFLAAVLLTITTITLYVVLRKKRRPKEHQMQAEQLTPVEYQVENINSQNYNPSESEFEHQQKDLDRRYSSIPALKSIQGMILPTKYYRPPKNLSKQSSFVSHVSSEYAFREDDRNSLNGHSELGSSLHSSVIETPNNYPGESKSFFQKLTGLLSGLSFVKSIWTTDSCVNIALSQEEFAINERCVRERLQVLLPKHEADIKKVNITTV